jgi:chitinase
MLSDHAPLPAARPPLAGAAAVPPGENWPDADDWQEPEGPVERLSWGRLAILLLVVAGVVMGGVAGVRHLRATTGPTAKSWAVPYVDVTLTPTFQFQDPQANPARDIALAFVVADRSDGCSPSWGAAYSFDQAATSLELDRRIAQLRAAGGHVMVSLGGQANTELAVACPDSARLAAAYREVVERYDLDALDVDVEGTALADQASIARRAAALADLQRQRAARGRPLAVWLTLPVTPDGLSADGLALVRTTLSGGVSVRGVNVMTMDYGSAAGSHPNMLDLTRRALTATHRQLSDVYLRLGVQLTEPQVWGRIGATPMIGQNDTDAERFAVADAEGLAAFALDKGLGRVSIWSLNRDAACRDTFADVVVHANTCSGIDQKALAFASVFTGLPGRAPASGSDVVTIPTMQAAADDARTSPYPVWRPNAQYPGGYKVVWHGVVYQAKWSTQGVDPSAAGEGTNTMPWSLIGPVKPTDEALRPTPSVSGVTAEWNPVILYVRGDRVLFDGLPYEARWSSKADAPSTEYPVGPEQPWRPLFQVPGEPVTP